MSVVEVDVQGRFKHTLDELCAHGVGHLYKLWKDDPERPWIDREYVYKTRPGGGYAYSIVGVSSSDCDENMADYWFLPLSADDYAAAAELLRVESSMLYDQANRISAAAGRALDLAGIYLAASRTPAPSPAP